MAGRKIEREILVPKGMTPPIAPYSHAVRVGSTMYISGQVGLDPATNETVPGGIVAETEQALKNLGSVLAAAGIGFSNVVKVTVLLADMDEFAAMNDVYKKYFTDAGKYPARAAYQVVKLPKNFRVEFEAVAVVGKIHDISKL